MLDYSPKRSWRDYPDEDGRLRPGIGGKRRLYLRSRVRSGWDVDSVAVTA